MRHTLALLLALGLGAGCGPTRPPKPPTPPTPTPAPVGTPLLKVVGNQFVPPILGSVTTHHGWPLCDKDCLDAINSAGLNYTAMRLPCELDDRPEYDMFVRVDADRVDLTRYNPAWDALHERTIAHADKLGIYVNQGLWDGWCAKHEGELRLFWKAAHNTQGVDIGSCSTFQRAPHPVVLSVVRHVETVVGKHANVIWELGNEANRCSPTDEFVDGVRQAVYDSETANGHPHHLWSPGTVEGSARGTRLDFVSMHGLPVAAEPTQPIEINEFAPQGQDEYLAHLAESRAKGVPAYHYWHDDNPNRTAARGAFKSLKTARPAEMSVESYRKATGKIVIKPEDLLGALAAGPEGFPASLKLAEVRAAATGAWDDQGWEDEWLDTMSKMGKVQPMQGCYDIPNETAVAVSPRPSADQKISDAVNAAIQRVMPGCTPTSGTCAINMSRNAWLLIVTAEIRKDPTMCAGVQTDSEGLVDQLCAGPIVPGTSRADLCQGHHSYTCNQGCTTGVVGWAPGSYTNRDGDTWVRP